MRVFLTGFMGAGKTSVGRALAVRTGLPFADLDHEIEARSGRSIREIFEQDGEPEFRRLERDVLAELLRRPGWERCVVATGGGTVATEPGARLLRSAGVTVWLNPPFATIVERVGALGKADRPLFRDETQAWELYRRRLDAYRRCDLKVDVAPEESPEEVAGRLHLLLAQRR
ncbi:MAG TPA: shikimate kinase [Thermoanaerobaculia bacterium]|nr:shikimate kinase [Thermoanaerobaculia bacterium]